MAFGPGGNLAAGYSRGGIFGVGGVVLLDAKGERLRADPIEVKEGRVTSVAFGPGGTLAAGYSRINGGVVLLDARGKRLRADPSEVGGLCHERGLRPRGHPRRRILARHRLLGDVGGVVLLDARGERLRADPIEVKEGGVTSVAFGPGGTLAAGYSRGDVSGVVLLNARGERLRADPSKEGRVTSVAFGPGGTLAAGYSAATSTA